MTFSIMQSVVKLDLIMPYVANNPFMLSVVMLSVIMLSVEAPLKRLEKGKRKL